MVKELFNKLEIEEVIPYGGGYLIRAKLAGTFTKYKFFFGEGNVFGYSNDHWVQLTAATQSLISAKFREYCVGQNRRGFSRDREQL